MPRAKRINCFYCDNEATLLCDCVIARFASADGGKTYLPADDQIIFTCDRPLCPDHAKHVGNTFYDGKESHIDSVDMCPDCDKKTGGRVIHRSIKFVNSAKEGEIMQKRRLMRLVKGSKYGQLTFDL